MSPAATANGLPYPSGGDALGAGASAVQDLAETLDPYLDASAVWVPTGNWTLGNGVVMGRKRVRPDWVDLDFWFRLGSTSAIAAGSFSLNLPVNFVGELGIDAGFGAVNPPIGYGVLRDNSATHDYVAVVVPSGLSTCGVRFHDAVGTLLDSNSPFTWATDDYINLHISYEPA